MSLVRNLAVGVEVKSLAVFKRKVNSMNGKQIIITETTTNMTHIDKI